MIKRGDQINSSEDDLTRRIRFEKRMLDPKMGWWNVVNPGNPQTILVSGLEHFFPYIGNNNSNWLIFFRGVETTNQHTCHGGKHGAAKDSCSCSAKFRAVCLCEFYLCVPARKKIWNQRRDETSVVDCADSALWAGPRLLASTISIQENPRNGMIPNVFPTFKRGVAQPSDVSCWCVHRNSCFCRSCFLSWHDMKSWWFIGTKL